MSTYEFSFHIKHTIRVCIKTGLADPNCKSGEPN